MCEYRTEYPCGCICHRIPGVKHFAPCCYPITDDNPASTIIGVLESYSDYGQYPPPAAS